ncbi:uncharacterized protein [Alexandromys fortis]|uniref:uncharacterized protein isoform X2 n=1 Tax=Alexandromys fortis TaxID=100897 RepID=UPI0021531B82|nr:uncharacterized protein LOC126505268 isoform X2 [Microtus fortis]
MIARESWHRCIASDPTFRTPCYQTWKRPGSLMRAGTCGMDTDNFSSWTEEFLTKHETAYVVAKKILEVILPRFDVPHMSGSDNGPAFVSQLHTFQPGDWVLVLATSTPQHQAVLKGTIPGDPYDSHHNRSGWNCPLGSPHPHSTIPLVTSGGKLEITPRSQQPPAIKTSLKWQPCYCCWPCFCSRCRTARHQPTPISQYSRHGLYTFPGLDFHPLERWRFIQVNGIFA